MSKLLNPKIEVRDSPIEGKGLFCKQAFKKGERFRVVEKSKDTSIIMTDEEFKEYQQTHDHWDAVALGNGKHRVGTESRDEDPSNYGNHSCDPNIAPYDDGVIALCNIQADEELTIDYAQFSTKDWEMKCNCKAKNCTGLVKGKL